MVIAGFGENEYTPSIVNMEIDGIIENRLKYSLGTSKRIDDKTASSIMPFAQKEMVYTFMQGINPDLESMIKESTEKVFYGIIKIILDKLKDNFPSKSKVQEDITSAGKELIGKLFKSWGDQSEKSHWRPIVSIATSLPKDELAAMAEALVNLTKFRRRVSDEKETVGGPIDVAVITKGDGFVWVKRKHYFDPKLNPRKMNNYLREIALNEI